jgi:hypothetical protein
MSGPDSPSPLRARLLWRLALIVALVALTGLALGGTIESLQSGAMMMLPALALAVAVLARPYLGAGAIARLRGSGTRPRRVAARMAVPLRPRSRVARGGRLIAVALAGRAPPPALAGCR